jgi:hypothetical protein
MPPDNGASMPEINGAQQRTALLRDEKLMAELEAHARANADKALACAASTVLESTGESGAYASEKTSWLTEDELQRICDRAGISSQPRDLHPLSFRDRHGRVHLPLDGMVRLAQAFAAAEPRAVSEYIDDQEDEYRLRGNAPGDRWWHRYLREQAPGFALARRWAGLEEEGDGLRQEIARLRVLVSTAASDLKAAGQERKAQRLIRALEGR